MPKRRTERSRVLRGPVFAAACLALLLSACDPTGEPEDGRIVAGVDLDLLFAEPTPQEIRDVLSDWSSRDVSVQNHTVVDTASLTLGGIPLTLRIVSHTVAGVQHYGALLIPAGAQVGRQPVLIYAHGGDEGTSIEELGLILAGIGRFSDQFIYVVPSFRAEPLVFRDMSYLSEGPSSPWDRDVDDALALLNAALQTTPEADPERIGVLGFSRGGTVALLMAVRDPRIDLVVEFFGPTDFFGPYVQDVVQDALLGRVRDLPGLDDLNAAFIQPLRHGVLTIDEVRPELVRRSAVLFASRLPQVQVHHGTADEVVAVTQASALEAAMQRLGRTAPDFEAYLYTGGGHHPLTLPGSIDRARTFLARLLPPPSAASQPSCCSRRPLLGAAGQESVD